ncbi:MAG: FG-GAP-like repeat-containing protein [Planctomycetes bacterium]|nr:FG-GAP-like repeat-containing protein [Planctomycetota bacterium]
MAEEAPALREPPPPPPPPPPSPVVTSPNGGETWTIGASETVSWTPGLVTSLVDLEITLDGITWIPLVTGTGNDGSESVTAPPTPSAVARVRVKETGTGASDVSDADFTVAGMLVSSPNGGESWSSGAAETVTWSAAGFPGTLDIEFSPDGSTWVALATGTSNDGTESVTAPVGPTTTARVRVTQSGGSATDESNSDFTVAGVQVTAPNGGETCVAGGTATVTWASAGLSGSVDLELTTDGSTWSTLLAGTANDGAQLVTVPPTPSTLARVRVKGSGGSASDVSDADFTITGIMVTSPNGGESWSAGGSETVTWAAAGFGGTVDVQISTDGVSWTTLAASTPNDGSTGVTAPTTLSTTARVRVKQTAGSMTDDSDADFTIAGLQVISPNGGETWYVGTSATVTWLSAGIAGSVDIDLSIDGSTWTSLVAGTANDGSQVVSVPAPSSATARVRVKQTGGSLSDTSDAVFAIAGIWTDIGAGLPGFAACALEWGDYDHDGDLDLAVAGDVGGTPTSAVYRNDSGTFVDVTAGLKGVGGRCAITWGDFDRDGDLDLALAGTVAGGAGASCIYRNDGGDVFTDVGAPLKGVIMGSLAWGDYDRDGDLDLALMGNSSLGDIVKIYRNDVDQFRDSGLSFIGMYLGTLKWGDYDNDGDLDLAMTGITTYVGKRTWLYRNDGTSFTNVTPAFPGLQYSSLDWGDFDNDGDLDLAIAGSNIFSGVAQIYRNDGGGVFTDIAAGLTGVEYACIRWGDVDNDGDLDLAVCGASFGGFVTKVYSNTGGAFVDTGAPLTGVYSGALSLGDEDGDGDLDLAVAGIASGGAFAGIYRNGVVASDSAPAAPAGLSATPGAGFVVAFSWTAATDDHTPASGLAYNLRIGTTSGSDEIFATMSDPATGLRRVPRRGPLQGIAESLVLNPGSYFWSVQAIDAGFKGGAWATEGTFTFDGIRVNSPNGQEVWRIGTTATVLWASHGTSGLVDIQYSVDGITWLPLAMGTADDGTESISVPSMPSGTARLRVSDASGPWTDSSDADFTINAWSDTGTTFVGTWHAMAWGDYDGDGDLDIGISGCPLGFPKTRIYRNDGVGVYADIGGTFANMDWAAIAWGDYDRDGDLDFVVSGYAAGSDTTILYRNDGGGVFVDSGAVLAGVHEGAFAWGDYDRDGDLDLALCGEQYPAAISVSKIYRNDGGGSFVDIGASLLGVHSCAIQWGDYDNDGDLDLALAGDGPGSANCHIYRNDGGGTFTDIVAGLTGIYACSLAWGDYDADGDLDLAAVGYSSAKIYRNDGSGVFTNIGAPLLKLGDSSAEWGDFDNDGDLDLVVSGQVSGASPYYTRLYLNSGGAFADCNAGLMDVTRGATAFGDEDNDGDLDIAITGVANGAAIVGKIYRNNIIASNSGPSSAGSPSAATGAGFVNLSWSAASDDHTPAAGLSYNLRVGTSPGGSEVFVPMADSGSGLARLPRRGPTQGTSATLFLPSGTYYWSVQAVDSSWAGGAWTAEGTFTIP